MGIFRTLPPKQSRSVALLPQRRKPRWATPTSQYDSPAGPPRPYFPLNEGYQQYSQQEPAGPLIQGAAKHIPNFRQNYITQRNLSERSVYGKAGTYVNPGLAQQTSGTKEKYLQKYGKSGAHFDRKGNLLGNVSAPETVAAYNTNVEQKEKQKAIHAKATEALHSKMKEMDEQDKVRKQMRNDNIEISSGVKFGLASGHLGISPFGAAHARGFSAKVASISAPVRQLKRFTKGSDRTLVLSEEANKVVDGLNMLLNARGAGGIRIHMSDSNWVIDGSNISTGSSSGGGSSEGGSISFRGIYAYATEYAANDVVIVYTTDGEDPDTGVYDGTYICLQDHTSAVSNKPPSYADISNDYWFTLSRGHWNVQWWGDETTPYDTYGYTKIHAGTLYVNFGSRSIPDGETTPTTLAINLETIPDDLKGKTISPQRFEICRDDGVKCYTYVLATTPVPIDE